MTIEVKNLTVCYGPFLALEDVSLRVDAGEVLSVLGPSGSGKTTLLLAIAGLLPRGARTEGHVLVGGADLGAVPASRRNIPMMFQSYALFPNMTVFGNVSFPLRVRHLPGSEIRSRTNEAMSLVHLSDKALRYPQELSGGEQQRVALARSLVLRPQAMLLDEPVGALDKHLRDELLAEIKELQRQIGITMLYVTHDQAEALCVSNRIAVLKNGALKQIGSSDDVYSHPGNVFVARFLGQVNLIRAVLRAVDGSQGVFVTSGGVELRTCVPVGRLETGKSYLLAVRPEQVKVGRDAEGFPGTVEESRSVGGAHSYSVRVKGMEQPITSTWRSTLEIAIGDNVNVSWSPFAVTPLEDESG